MFPGYSSPITARFRSIWRQLLWSSPSVTHNHRDRIWGKDHKALRCFWAFHFHRMSSLSDGNQSGQRLGLITWSRTDAELLVLFTTEIKLTHKDDFKTRIILCPGNWIKPIGRVDVISILDSEETSNGFEDVLCTDKKKKKFFLTFIFPNSGADPGLPIEW